MNHLPLSGIITSSQWPLLSLICVAFGTYITELIIYWTSHSPAQNPWKPPSCLTVEWSPGSLVWCTGFWLIWFRPDALVSILLVTFFIFAVQASRTTVVSPKHSGHSHLCLGPLHFFLLLLSLSVTTQLRCNTLCDHPSWAIRAPWAELYFSIKSGFPPPLLSRSWVP